MERVWTLYTRATGWNNDNLYSNLTRNSTSILDFSVKNGMHFSVSKSPNPYFGTSYLMQALPKLSGTVSYLYSSRELDFGSSRESKFRDAATDCFRPFNIPCRPEAKEEVWLAGERVDERGEHSQKCIAAATNTLKLDYLLFGRVSIPSGRLDAVHSVRLSPTFQSVVSMVSDPKQNTANNLLLQLQHDTGKWCTEYTGSAEDGMLGLRVLHNFSRRVDTNSDILPSTENGTATQARPKRVDEEEEMEGGLSGCLSAGAELYFSLRERSAGASAGIRFTTLPDVFPPTTITATVNPMMGHLSGAYAARVSRDLALCSRFDFNVYSYQSEWALGAEWWTQGREAVVKARLSTNTDLSLKWEGRLQNVLCSFGFVSNLTSRHKPILALGIELSYFDSD